MNLIEAALVSTLLGVQELQECSRQEVHAYVTALETLASPCMYYLSFSEVTIDRQGPIEARQEFLDILSVARAGANGQASAAFTNVAHAYESLVGSFPSLGCLRSSYRDFEALETSAPSVQLEEIVSPRTWGYLATLRKEDFSLRFSINRPGIGHQLQAVPSSRTNIIYDMQQLLTPLMIDSESLANLREHEWSHSPSGFGDVVPVTVRPRDQLSAGYCLEYSRETGMPVAVSLKGNEAGQEFTLMGLFEYRPVESGGGIVWLSGGISIIVQEESALVARWQLTGTTFDVDTKNTRIKVTDQTVCFDWRTANRAFYSKQDSWPNDLISCVEFGDTPYLVLDDGYGAELDTANDVSKDDAGIIDASFLPTSSERSSNTILRWVGTWTIVAALLIGLARWGAASRSK